MTDFDARARTWDEDPQKVARALRVADAIAERVPGLANRSVLEYGSGTGLLGFALRGRAAALTLADASREMTAVAREKIAALGARDVAAVQLDLTAGPLPDARYDLVCTLLALHHVPNVPALLRRFHAVLAPGGRLCAADLDEEDGSFHGEGADVHRGFARDRMAAWLAEAGFRDARFETVFEIEKPVRGQPRRYPVFLVTASA